MDRQRRLQLLVRQNRARVEFKTYSEELEKLLKVKIEDQDRIGLETTDRLFAAHTKELQQNLHQPQNCFQKTWTYEPTRAWSDECDRLGGALHDLEGVLFVGPFQYCGAVRVPLDRALQVAALLLTFDGDTLNLGTVDAASGLYVDKYEQQSEWFVEFIVWGEWAKLMTPVLAG